MWIFANLFKITFHSWFSMCLTSPWSKWVMREFAGYCLCELIAHWSTVISAYILDWKYTSCTYGFSCCSRSQKAGSFKDACRRVHRLKDPFKLMFKHSSYFQIIWVFRGSSQLFWLHNRSKMRACLYQGGLDRLMMLELQSTQELLWVAWQYGRDFYAWLQLSLIWQVCQARDGTAA